MSILSQAIDSSIIEFDLLLYEVEDNFLDWIFQEQLIQQDTNILDDIHEFTKTGVIL